MSFSDSSQFDIIIGCSSGAVSNSAVSVIRISGNFLVEKFQPFFSKSLIQITPRCMHLSKIIDKDLILDELLFCFFPAPKSYTGENILELYPHGNVLNVKRIINSFVEAFSLRAARPGEFTLRAFKNKKLNFAQVEGLELLLNANSQFAFSQGLQVLNGDLFRAYRQLYDEFISMKSAISLLIDFAEDVGELEARRLFSDSILSFGSIISDLYRRINIQTVTALNPRILIFGPTNAGKSSFFNFLLSESRSIVSDIPGTTRDFVSEAIEIDGNQFILTDSAGIREVADSVVEVEGMRRSRHLLSSSFYKLMVVSGLDLTSLHFETYDFDMLLITHCDLCSFSKDDLSNFSKKFRCPVLFLASVEKCFGPIEPATFQSGPMGPLLFSYKLSHYLNVASGSIGPDEFSVVSLFKLLVSCKYKDLIAQNPILIERHKTVISSIYDEFQQIPLHLDQQDLGIISSKINALGLVVNNLIGIVTPDHALDLVFSRFCIGK